MHPVTALCVTITITVIITMLIGIIVIIVSGLGFYGSKNVLKYVLNNMPRRLMGGKKYNLFKVFFFAFV